MQQNNGEKPMEKEDIYILAVESSCDETAASVVRNGREVLSNIIYSQIDLHTLYGGVVPEIASRKHIEKVNQVIEKALSDAGITLEEVTAVAVTYGPGLVGALLVGVSAAKAIAFAADKPLVGVHHIEGHISANFIENKDLEPPFICLVVSGGHSHLVVVKDYGEYEIIGRTRDDAAGEAFDKAARCVGLPYPGGVALDAISHEGNPHAYPLPTPHAEGEFNFSFSGLKTAVINLAHNAEQKGQPLVPADLAASFCCHVSEILWQKTALAAERCGCDKIVLAGGVSANSWLRQRARQGCAEKGWQLYMPPLSLTGDNAAMIGAQAYYEYLAGHTADESLNGLPTMEITEQFGA